MKRVIFILAALLFIVPAGVFAASIGDPMRTLDEAWQSVVDNAYRIAEEYAGRITRVPPS